MKLREIIPQSASCEDAGRMPRETFLREIYIFLHPSALAIIKKRCISKLIGIWFKRPKRSLSNKCLPRELYLNIFCITFFILELSFSLVFCRSTISLKGLFYCRSVLQRKRCANNGLMKQERHFPRRRFSSAVSFARKSNKEIFPRLSWIFLQSLRYLIS